MGTILAIVAFILLSYLLFLSARVADELIQTAKAARAYLERRANEHIGDRD